MAQLVIGLVGVCGAGKSSLGHRLRAAGYHVKHIAQEHSYVPHMWQKISKPDILIFLDVSYANTIIRRNLHWSEAEYEEQLRRLEHARRHAQIYIDTDQYTLDEVVDLAIKHIEAHK